MYEGKRQKKTIKLKMKKRAVRDEKTIHSVAYRYEYKRVLYRSERGRGRKDDCHF